MSWTIGNWNKGRGKANPARNSRARLAVLPLEERVTPAVADFTVVAGSSGTGLVRVQTTDANPTTRFDLYPYGVGFQAPIVTAVGDVNGDGIPDIVTAPGGNAPSHVRVFDGNTGQQLVGNIGSFYANPVSYTGGASLAVGDVNSDSRADIIVGNEGGLRSVVNVFDAATGALFTAFTAYASNNVAVRVAAGDVTGDGVPDIVTGAGVGGGPHVKVFNVAGGSAVENSSFFAYASTFLGGVYVAAGDINGDGRADVVTGAGAGGGPHVKVFGGLGLPGTQLASFFAYSPSFSGGVRVAVGNVPNFGNGVLTVAGNNGSVHVKRYDASFIERSSYFGAPGNNGGFVAAVGPTSRAAFTTGVSNLYLFQAPGNTANTVVALTASAFAGSRTSTVFDPNKTYTIHIDNTDDGIISDNVTFRVSFGPPSVLGVQTVTLHKITDGTPTILATSTPNSNAGLNGLSGQFFAGTADDPQFYDRTGFENLAQNGTGVFPRAVGTARNFYGPSANTLAMVIDIPTGELIGATSVIRAWASSETLGVQTDRVGNGLIRDMILPQFPRTNALQTDKRTLYDESTPATDATNFLADAISILQSPPYNRTTPQATTIAGAFVPDQLTFDTTTPFTTNSTDANGFANGRRLRDDSFDVLINLFTGGVITGDNVADDNANKITDGTQISPGNFRPVLFPYVGVPNAPAGAPNVG